MAVSNSHVFTEDKLWQKSEAALERASHEADGLAQRMHATYRLVDQCLQIINANPRSEGFSLVTKEGGTRRMTAMVEETSELNQLQSICESAGFYESVQSETPNLRRMRLFDQMLEEAGHPGRFYLIKDEKVARQAADEMARFLFSRDRSEVIDALASGKKTLADFGISQFSPSSDPIEKINDGTRIVNSENEVVLPRLNNK